MMIRSFFRVRTLLSALLAAIWIFSIVSIWRTMRNNYTDSSQTPNPIQVSHALTVAHQRFWLKFHGQLERYAPATEPVIEYEKAPTERFDPKNSHPRPDLLALDRESIEIMKEAHTGFVRAITTSPPDLKYIPDTKGIVSTAGGSYLPVVVISLRMLRRTGSKLPMEIFLADETEYEQYICDEVLPSLNAKCIILSKILHAAPANIKTFQFKPLAMLFSSFEEILFLDADAFPLEKPETLFSSEPFRIHHMVTWPDFWGPSSSLLFYEIAGISAPPMSQRQSTESGELLLSKKTHMHTLLLSTYYNYWGPSHYYPLLSQGAAGEGDKETFIAAALAMNNPFYQVSEPICALGHRKDAGGGFAGSAMAQFNPIQDYKLTSQDKWRVRGDEAPTPDVFFIHANFPKFNPATVFGKHEVNPAFLDDGTPTRAWTIPEDVVRQFNDKVDIEKSFWEEILWTACELEDKFDTWDDRIGVCAGVQDYWRKIYGTKGMPSYKGRREVY